MDEWTLIRFVHVVALAFFVGGQLVLAAVVVPALRRHDPGAMRSVARLFGLATLVALVLLVATGAALASHVDLWSSSTLQLKLMLLVLVGVLTGLHVAAPPSRVISTGILLSSLAIVWLGVELSH